MKQFNFQSRFVILLLGFLTFGISQAWGDDVFYTNNCPEDTKAKYYADEKTTTVNGIDWTGKVNRNATGDWRLGGKTAQANKPETVDRYFYTKTKLSDPVSKIVITYASTNTVTSVNSVTLEVYSTAELAAAGATGDISSLTGTYEASKTCVYSCPVGKSWKDVFFRFKYNITLPTNSNKCIAISSIEFYKATTPSFTITPQSNNNSWGTVDLSGSTITASPKEGYRYANPAYTVTPNGSASVEQDGNEFTVTPTANCTVQINFEQIPTHDAKFYVNNVQYGSTQTLAEGAAISLPTPPEAPDGCYEKAFYGWTTSKTVNPSTAPEIISNPVMGNNDVTYYAVFADVSGAGSTTVLHSQPGTITSGDYYLIDTYGGVNYQGNETGDYWALKGGLDASSGTKGGIPAVDVTNAISVNEGVLTLNLENLTTETTPSVYTITLEDDSVSFALKDGDVFYNAGDNVNADLQTAKAYRWKSITDETGEYAGRHMLYVSRGTGSRCLMYNDHTSGSSSASQGNQQHKFKMYALTYSNDGGTKGPENSYGSGKLYFVPATTVSYTDYITECCPQPVTPLAITTAERTVQLGGSLTLSVEGGNGGAKVWGSSDEDVATVENGVVTPHAKGTTTISVSQEANDTYCEQYVEVEIEVISASEFGISFVEVTGGSAVAKIGDDEVTKAETNQEVTILASENPGYTFISWAATGVTIATPTENPTTFIMGDEAVTITPSFGYKTYNIIYKDKGGTDYSGSNGDALVKTHTYNTLTELVVGAKDNATFMGWYTDDACTESNKVTSLAATAFTDNITLYAKWGYEVKFYNNADQIGETKIVEAGTAIGTLPEKGEMISCNEDGSDTFMGWMIGKITGSQDDAPTFVQSTDVVNSARDIYAVWAKGTAQGEPEEHTVVWSINGVTTPSDKYTPTNTTLTTSSIDPTTETGVWTAVTTSACYSSTDGGAHFGSGDTKFNGTITLSGTAIPSNATITKVSLSGTTNAASGSKFTIGVKVNGNALANNKEIYDNTNNANWSGSQVGNEIVFTFSCNNNRNIIIQSITVEYSVVALVYSQYITNCSDLVKPEFTVAEGGYYKSQTFGLTQSQSKAIFYTTDGSDPKEQGKGTAYQNSFTLSETATIKARATDGYGDWSSLATCTYTIYPTYTSIPAIQNAVETTEANATIEISDPWLITAIYGSGAATTYAYAVNSSNQGLLMYTEGGHGFEVGDKFTGAADKSIKKVDGAPRVNGIKANKMSVTHNNPVDATEVTSFSTITATNHSALVTLMNAQANVSGDIVTLSDGTTSLTFFDKFGTGLTASNFINTARYNVTGIIMLNGTTIQIAPRTTANVEWIHGTLNNPTNLVWGEVGTTKVSLSWDAVDNISSYLVTYNGATTNVSTNAVNLTGLTSNADYTWSVQAIGDGISYISSETIDGEPFHTLNPLDVKHSITYHVEAGEVAAGAASEVADGYTFTYPEVTLECSGGFSFAGWTDQSDFADGTTAPEHFYAANTTSNPVGEDIDLYAVYTKGSTNTLTFEEFIADPSIAEADFVIAAKVGNEDYRPVPNKGYIDDGSTMAAGTTITDITDADKLNAAKITIVRASTSGYNLKYADNRYIVGKASSNTSLTYATSASATGWALSSSELQGSYRLISAVSGSRQLRYSTEASKFGNYGNPQVGSENKYYDLEIIGIPVSSTQYTLTPDCRTERALVLESSEGETFRLNEKTGVETSDNITVTFSAQEGTGSGGEITLSLPTAYEGVMVDNTNKTVKFTKTGTYLIKADQDATQDYQAVSASLSVTVQKALNTLSYNANGGENAPASQTDENGKQVEVASRGAMTNGIKAFRCWNTQADGQGQNYNPGNKYTLDGSATLYAVWVDALTVTIDPTIEHGTVTATPEYALQSDQITLTITPEDGYTLVPNSVIITKENGGTVNFNTNTNTFYMPNENVTVTASFAVGALYTIDGWDNSAEKLATSQTGEPAGSSYTLTNTYPTSTNHQKVDQITDGNKITLTLSGYNGKFITGITMNMHSNASAGAGTFSAKVGSQDAFASISSATKFDKWFDNTSCGTEYRPVHVTLPQDHYVYVGENEDVVIEIACTTKSLYCESFFIEYVDGYRRDMSNGYMGTHCYPFDIAAGDYKGAQFYEIAYRIGNTRIYFDQVDHVEAGVPYLVVPEENGSILEAIVSPKDVVAGTSKGFIGSYTQEQITKNENYYIVYNNEFRRVGNNVFVGANRAYIDLTQVRDDDPQAGNPKAPRRISLRNSDSGTPTGINNIREEFGNPNGGAMKVFHENKIYILREGNVYNGQGIKLK